ncbi:hydrogenase small subunit, partial [Campylobacter jejuni]|nr:hydrogenase small subunit [Campylobacter jejuni]ELI8778259.1 hydrogenase small subunit [Campylobacter jejuni]HEH3717192.1 hydrogenase small subunit [Campylobacter jejuni]
MAKLSNEELKNILEDRIKKLENSTLKEDKVINEESVKILARHLSLGNEIPALAQRFFQIAPKTKLVWLHLCECTGCSESLLRSELPSFDELIFDFFSLEYHETLMAANGTKAEELLEHVLEEDFILAVEGGVAAIDTFFLTIGAQGESGYEILEKLAAKAKAIFAVGTCSSYGGIQAAYPNPSKTCGISEVLSQKVVNIPGCPPSDINIIATLSFFALFGVLPELDEQNRPVWAYGKCLHDMCERKAKFESGIFAEHFDDEAAKNGACLFKIGCKGPYTYNNCPKVKFNAKTSWPVAAGHGCIACSEKNFWDEFGNYEKPMANIFSYAKLCNEELKQEFFLEEQIKILEQIDFEFESNIKLILQNIAKNKLGALLVENY